MEKINEVRVCTIGQVDAGKSTLLGVLTNNENKDSIRFLDDGRGKARSNILKLKHEKDSGRTSNITQCYISKKEKIITFIDLAGHEKYLKTTIRGLSGNMCDYALLVIGSNTGIIPRMTKEHIGIALTFNVPIITVITKTDMSNHNKINDTKKRIERIMTSKAANKHKIMNISDMEDVDKCLKVFNSEKICPLFLVSNTTGENIDILKKFIEKLDTRVDWRKEDLKKKLLYIEDVFSVPGIGTVISGIVRSGVIYKNDQLFIGPFSGKYRKIVVKNIHNNFRQNIDYARAGVTCNLWIKSVTKEKVYKKIIKRGMVLTDEEKCVSEFSANILILHNPTTIRKNYEPIIHCRNIRQSAKIMWIKNDENEEKNSIRGGDKAIVRFKFMFHPEFIENESILLFREGRTKGIGKVSQID
tara:strand:+ start:314 stop:1558 length:1245 start_codon:yes stop_codon:yes gene_type:complete